MSERCFILRSFQQGSSDAQGCIPMLKSAACELLSAWRLPDTDPTCAPLHSMQQSQNRWFWDSLVIDVSAMQESQSKSKAILAALAPGFNATLPIT